VKPMAKAIALALIQVLIVSSLGAKLLYDRRTRPQAWFRTARYDPNLPIRGRYVSLQIEVKDSRSAREVEVNSRTNFVSWTTDNLASIALAASDGSAVPLR
jgi:hypothetical protein